MTSRTHDLAAFTLLNILIVTRPLPLISFSTGVASIGACFLGGLLPDLDKPTSEFWQKFPGGTFFGELFHPFLGGHRLISHSFLGVVVFGFLLKYLLFLASKTILVNMDIVWLSFMVGFISHLTMDSLTTEGIPLFFPLSFHFGFPPFKSLRIKTSGILEKAFVFPALLISNIYFFYHYYQVYLNLIKSFLK
jgi:inner membrane protein